ncbi:RapZ C-terminal domain-containing protein [Streptomyces cucumeris]|uniref:RapZ C-terminal domain-containing protein n=1 Tax=Streptomyces cucumeris TaxID=2962890 RepID=UPI003D7097BB
MSRVEITSFGYLHGAEPDARIKLDLRHHFRDPHVNPELRYLTAHDQAVRDAVMATEGVEQLLQAAEAMVGAYLAGPRQDEPVTVAVGCAGGRHRAATAASVLAERCAARGLDVDLVHRDLAKPVVERTYAPVDVTPPELQPSALADHVPDWAEAAPTPTDVQDWPQRQAAALVPFQLDARGWPLHPQGRTGRTGRNLGRWGENQAADPIVVAGTGDQRRVLLITRDDIEEEAIPGGMVDPGETAPAALVRELREETGVDLSGHRPVILGRDVVDDWRASDHAWVASTSALYMLPATVTAVAADDALDATWYPFGSLDQLDAAITAAGRTLYAAHRPLLQRALDHLDQG